MAVRRATAADADELVRLRVLMYEQWGGPAGDAGSWRAACREMFAARLDGPDLRGYVVDRETGDGLAACGVGWVESHLPGPRNATGRRGHVANMCTEPAYQRRGYAREVFGALMGWFAELGVPRVELRATPMGEPLYRDFGFREPPAATLIWSAPR